MTWSFLYLAVLLIGVILTTVIGGLRNHNHVRTQHRHLVLPHADHRGALASLIALRASIALAGSGLAGLLGSTLLALSPRANLVAAVVVAAVFALVAIVLVRPRCAPALRSGRATVVREIVPGGYGQIRVEQGDQAVLLAAQSVDERPIPAGAEVEVLDCDRSVVRVRLAGTP